ncbi:siderophore-interacting protein [Sphaerisporangium rufum]|uniref:Siderophore-interacting protein n=1 Tax=Sphaerisporangium rufum TaxID=1381558 RepID=A0A919V474_9ACTN|nr:siderophore-interacting protein [Sphaerisporangium rufum]GII76980.1 siderophore-interacting protein [Sphaerisporangium rufum]
MTEPFRAFQVRVRRLARLAPSFVRVTFTGDDLDRFADNGLDQRIKVVLPAPRGGVAAFPSGPGWHARWRAQPDAERNPMRTYTVRAVRPAAREVDVDFVVHGDGGPAARWVATVAPGGAAVLLGPDAAHPGPHGGVEFRPPAGCGTVLLAGDETAVPAIVSILDRLPAGLSGEALMEVPCREDVLPVTVPDAMNVCWLPRDGAARGSLLVPQVRAAAGRLLPRRAPAPVPDEDDRAAGELWEVPEEAAPAGQAYAWLAGEASLIRTLRRYLVAERGMDRRAVAFMGYWRQGRAEGAA